MSFLVAFLNADVGVEVHVSCCAWWAQNSLGSLRDAACTSDVMFREPMVSGMGNVCTGRVCILYICVTANLQARNHSYMMYLPCIGEPSLCRTGTLQLSVERTCRVGGEDEMRQQPQMPSPFWLALTSPQPPHFVASPQSQQNRYKREGSFSMGEGRASEGWRQLDVAGLTTYVVDWTLCFHPTS